MEERVSQSGGVGKERVTVTTLRGPPRKNQTKMNFFRQGSKNEILSIFAYK